MLLSAVKHQLTVYMIVFICIEYQDDFANSDTILLVNYVPQRQ
jgi:hypothetical protein